MADENVRPVTGISIKEAAQRAIDKGRRESLEGKLKEHLKKRSEHERAMRQIDTEIEAEIAAYESGT